MVDRRHFLKQGIATSAALLCFREAAALSSEVPAAAALPGDYFRRMAKWCPVVAARLKKESGATLKELEATPGWYHFPYTILAAAVLYSKQNAENPFYKKQEMLHLALQIGDLLVREDKAGTFAPRLDSYRDTYMWVEAYALLKEQLGEERSRLWQQAIERNITLLLPEIATSRDMPAYTENFIGSSPNHLAWWSATAMVAGLHLHKRDWLTLGGGVLRRFATTEQNPDGYWGEHNPNGPTGGYNYIDVLAVGVYWEITKDPDALKALRRATDFHANFTYPDGNLIELFNDRNRYWHVSYWGQFGFSHFPDGRGYAYMLMQHTDDTNIDLDMLGLLAQNALYYHEGPAAVPPPQQQAYAHRLTAEAGVRKRGPWVTGLCGIMDTPLPRSQWFLERQANLSLFHERVGLIVSGANSKHQPELSTFSEKIENEWMIAPKGSRFAQFDDGDVLALAYNTFSAEILCPPPSKEEAQIHVRLTGRGPVPQEAYFALQLVLKPGAELKTGAGRALTVSESKIDMNAHDLGGSIQHNGWTLSLDSDASLRWPVYPYNPYRNAVETKIDHAVALLRVPLQLKQPPGRWLRPNERTIKLRFQVPS